MLCSDSRARSFLSWLLQFLHTLAKKYEAYLETLEAEARLAGNTSEAMPPDPNRSTRTPPQWEAERLAKLKKSLEATREDDEQEDVAAGAVAVEYNITLPVLLERASDIFQKLVKVKNDSGGLLTRELLLLVQGDGPSSH